jgi:glutamate N-acetyltransferase/amino-acid N-acetyltransferase
MDAVSVTTPKGFRAAGVAAGIKAGGLDLAVLVADRRAVAAGVFTRNQAAAAPVALSREHLETGVGVRAIVVNSGCANAATGETGRKNAVRMAEAAARAVGEPAEAVLVCSTGTIGPQLPMDAVLSGIEQAMATATPSGESATAAAEAIHTTDTLVKQAAYVGDGWSIGGMAKGAGMVRPDMATMLAFLTTDAEVDATFLHGSLVRAADRSFNSLNIDGCESTNDSLIAVASGASGVVPGRDEFRSGLESVCIDLATQMARDAEGASRVVTIAVDGARDEDMARSLGRSVSDSALVRSSFYGGDVNWGRIVGALGTASTPIDFSAVTIAYQGVTVFAHGVGAPHDEDALLAECATGDLAVTISLGAGDGAATVVTTDLTPEYVIFNGERS